MRSIDYFDKGAEIAPSRTAVIDGDYEINYRDLQGQTHDMARAMWKAGLELGEPVAIYAPNHVGVLLCLLSIWRSGAVWVPVNAKNALDANIQYLNYVRASWLFYHSMYAAEAREIRKQVPSIQHLVCLDGDDAEYPSTERFMQEGRDGPYLDWSDPFGKPDHIVGIFPTGGTTGPSKGVNVTNLGWGTMLQMALNYWKVDDDIEPVCLSTAPITHAAGVMATVAHAMGATNVILPGFDAGKVLAYIEKYQVTHMYLPPTALYSLLDHPKLGDYDYSSLKVFLLVGSPVAPDKLKRAVEVFGPCLCQCFGQVEAPMILTWLPQKDVAAAAAGDRPHRLASCGKPSYAMLVKIMDEDGNILPRGETGEIVARGTLVSHSYFEKPEATTEVRTHGWHHTGDVGYQDEDGYIYIVDRKKDMIITGGFNVFSAEVEASIMELPEIIECAVIGKPDPKWGEAVTAICKLADGASITADEVIRHCKARLGSVKAPKFVEFWPDLPKTPNGKMDKKTIRKRFWPEGGRSVG